MDTVTLHKYLNAIGPEWAQIEPKGVKLPCFIFSGADKMTRLQVPFCVLERICDSIAKYNEAWETHPTSVYDLVMDDVFHADDRAVESLLQRPDMQEAVQRIRALEPDDPEDANDLNSGQNFGAMMMVLDDLRDDGFAIMPESFDHLRSLMIENADVILFLPYCMFHKCGEVIGEYEFSEECDDVASHVGAAISVVANLYNSENGVFCY